MRPNQSGRTLFAFVSAAILLSPAVRAQTVAVEPQSGAEVAASLRRYGHAGGALAVLTQTRKPQARQTMDDIADSLVAIAATLPGNDSRASATRTAARTILKHAGMGVSGVVGIERGTPYAGASIRLMRLAETAEDIGIRGGALQALSELPDQGGVSEFLQRIGSHAQHAEKRVAGPRVPAILILIVHVDTIQRDVGLIEPAAVHRTARGDAGL